jgi:hypothetical protein
MALRGLAATAFPLALALSSCSQIDGDARVVQHAPSRDELPLVSTVLEPRCGTLDCHGGPARSLRIYGRFGLRARGDHAPGEPDTTEEELDQTYLSLVGIDPEGLDVVLHAGGRSPERFLVISKARGVEKHEGGRALEAGSAGDRCLVSWVGGHVDEAACAEHVYGPTPREGETW